jgi:hypothetical protein
VLRFCSGITRGLEKSVKLSLGDFWRCGTAAAAHLPLQSPVTFHFHYTGRIGDFGFQSLNAVNPALATLRTVNITLFCTDLSASRVFSHQNRTRIARAPGGRHQKPPSQH